MTSTDSGSVSALVSLGSNIDPEVHLRRAVAELRRRFRVTASSSVWASEAKGAPGTPPFLNAAVALETELPARSLKFDVLRVIEADMGRRRGKDPNAPRVIDLDLSMYGDLVVNDPAGGLVLPDPEIVDSAHVVLPLAEIAPRRKHPVLGETLERLAEPFRGDAGIRTVGRLGRAVRR